MAVLLCCLLGDDLLQGAQNTVTVVFFQICAIPVQLQFRGVLVIDLYDSFSCLVPLDAWIEGG